MRGPFENGDFRRLFAGRVVTNIGDSLYFVAAMWLVYALTNDPFYSGLAGFLVMAPSALQFLFGPLVDRWRIRRVLVGTQAVQGVLVLAVPLADHFDVLSVWVVLAVIPLLSVLNQLVYPAQTAALPRLLDDEDLVAANSAFSVAYQGVDMVANALGGVAVALIGAVSLFVVDSVTFAAATLLFATVYVPPVGSGDEPSSDDGSGSDEAPAGETGSGRTATDDGSDPEPGSSAVADGGSEPVAGDGEGSSADATDPADDPEDPAGYLADLREGAGFLRGTFLLKLIAGAAVVNVSGGVMLASMPAYADRLGGAGAYGLLMAGFAGGMLLGALGASAVDDRPLGRLLVAAFGLTAVGWTGALLVDWLPGTVALFLVAFVPVGAVNVLIAALVQSAVPDRLVGRVSSVLGSASSSAVPIGALAGGAAASAVGPRSTLLAVGVLFALLAAYVFVVPSLRRLPPVGEVALDGRA